MIVLKIDVLKIPKDRIFVGKKGKYLDLVLVENKGGTDDYGNDGFISVSITKAERDTGGRGEIVGNWKRVGERPAAPAPRPQQPAPAPARRKPADPDLDAPEEDDIPF